MGMSASRQTETGPRSACRDHWGPSTSQGDGQRIWRTSVACDERATDGGRTSTCISRLELFSLGKAKSLKTIGLGKPHAVRRVPPKMYGLNLASSDFVSENSTRLLPDVYKLIHETYSNRVCRKGVEKREKEEVGTWGRVEKRGLESGGGAESLLLFSGPTPCVMLLPSIDALHPERTGSGWDDDQFTGRGPEPVRASSCGGGCP